MAVGCCGGGWDEFEKEMGRGGQYQVPPPSVRLGDKGECSGGEAMKRRRRRWRRSRKTRGTLAGALGLVYENGAFWRRSDRNEDRRKRWISFYSQLAPRLWLDGNGTTELTSVSAALKNKRKLFCPRVRSSGRTTHMPDYRWIYRRADRVRRDQAPENFANNSSARENGRRKNICRPLCHASSLEREADEGSFLPPQLSSPSRPLSLSRPSPLSRSISQPANLPISLSPVPLLSPTRSPRQAISPLVPPLSLLGKRSHEASDGSLSLLPPATPLSIGSLSLLHCSCKWVLFLQVDFLRQERFCLGSSRRRVNLSSITSCFKTPNGGIA